MVENNKPRPWKVGEPLLMQSDRFVIRSALPKFIDDVYIGWWNDEEVQIGLNAKPRGWGQKQALAHVAKFDNKYRFHFLIFPKGAKDPIGFMSVFIEAGKIARSNIAIGNKNWWGDKVVVEVRDRVFRFLFVNLRMEKIYGKVQARNFPSIYNYKAQGFSCEGVLRQHMVMPDKERVDQIVFGLLRSEWEALQDGK